MFNISDDAKGIRVITSPPIPAPAGEAALTCADANEMCPSDCLCLAAARIYQKVMTPG